ncbi:MAG: NnrS family protein, partial [Gammaproteobacteria bacterium]
WLRARGRSRLPVVSASVDRATILVTLAAGLSLAAAPASPVTGGMAFAAALAHGIRLARWRSLSTVGEPLLFVLHFAYLWLPLGYLLTGCAVLGLWFPPTAALHALTMGAIGSMILAVSTRVALAHTGRKLHAARLTVVAYCLLGLAVIVRVLSAWSGSAYLALVDLSALGWVVAFGIFCWVYRPILTRPRID